MTIGLSLGFGHENTRNMGGMQLLEAAQISGDWANCDGSEDGSWTSVMSSATARGHASVAIDDTRAFTAYRDDVPTGNLCVFITTRDGTSLTGGAVTTSANGTAINYPAVTYMGNDRALTFVNQTSDILVELWDTSGAAPVSLDSAQASGNMDTSINTIKRLDDTRAIALYQSNADKMVGVAVDVTGDSITIGTPVELLDTLSSPYPAQVQVMNDTYFLAKSGSTDSDIVLGSVSGLTVALEDTAASNADGEDYLVSPIYIEVFNETTAILFTESVFGSSRNTVGKVVTRSGDTITVGALQEFITDLENFTQQVNYGAGMNDGFGFLALKKSSAAYGKVYQLDGSTVNEISATVNLSTPGTFDHSTVVQFNNRYLGVFAQWDTSTPANQIYAKVIDGGELD